MKNVYKFFLALGVCSAVFAQIPEITRLSVQDNSQSIQESAPVWVSENVIIIFFANETRDTIFSTKSTNGGRNWIQPKVVQIVSVPIQQTSLDLATLKTNTGRILLAWSINSESMKLIYSDDHGNSWSQPINILGGGSPPVVQKSSRELNLSQWKTGELCLSFSSSSLQKSFYKLSSDDGITWGADPFNFPEVQYYAVHNLSINSVGDNILLATYEMSEFTESDIYLRRSTDNGINWSMPQLITGGVNHANRPKISILINGNIIITYLRGIANQTTGWDDDDIFHKTSFDSGLSWSAETRFTKYVGQDSYISPTSFQNRVFISFATERFSKSQRNENNFQVAYGILGESVELFTPPKIYSAYVPPELIDYDKKEFVYRALVVDDEAVQTVSASMENGIYTAEMYDDGLHNDESANDSVFANVFPFIQERYLEGYSLNVNKIDLPLDNKGVLADVNVIFGQQGVITANDLEDNQALYEGNVLIGSFGSQGKFEEGAFLFSGGFFLSGYSDGNLFANAIASAGLVEDYLPGKAGSLPDDPLNVLYTVNKNDPPFGTSWQRWKDAVSLGAEFYDGDKDGFYNPVDKNLNETWDFNEDMPMLIGDETIWCIYNDGLPDSLRRWQSEPQGIEVKQTLFATEDTELENIIFIRYSILNTGSVADVLDSVYFGIYEDSDLGDATDDVVGCDTLLNSGFFYNNSPDMVYGDNCPAFFSSLLQGPVIETNENTDTAKINLGQLLGSKSISGEKNLSITSHAFMVGGDVTLNDPSTVENARNYLKGKMRTGNFPDPCSWAYGEVRGGVDCNQVNPEFWVSGDPVTNVGWINDQNRDMRNLVSTGPFKLEKNNPQEIIIAYVIGRGTDYLNSITVARENVQRAIEEYKSNFASMTFIPPPAIPITNYLLYQNYPNPFNPFTTIRYELPQDGIVTIEVFDILGQKVGTLVNESKRTGRYEVKLNSVGLASGVYIYQLRVNEFITSKKMLLIK